MLVLAATRRHLCVLLLALALFCILLIASEQVRGRRLDLRLHDGWERFRSDFSRTQYEELFGPPTATWVEGGIDFIRWDGRELFLELEFRDSGVVYCFGHQPTLSRSLDEWWVKRFHCKSPHNW
jgi:hypothetical protein